MVALLSLTQADSSVRVVEWGLSRERRDAKRRDVQVRYPGSVFCGVCAVEGGVGDKGVGDYFSSCGYVVGGF